MTLSPTEIFYVLIGLASIGLVFWFNRPLYKPGGPAGAVGGIEAVYYLTALVALLVGWYFNFQYFRQYGAEAGWLHWTKLLFVNPASASGGQDLIIANLVLFPLWTVIDGRRSGMRHAWWYFPMSLLTSYAFGLALYLAVKERQVRSR
ncbi:MAG TPA: DUF2834 domain-containing protein [Candidatus Binatia bacterium]|nr:DUF2834 domain-containing protein [Candidatus Binatia bacterium]